MRKRAIDHPLHIIVSGHMTISIDMPGTRSDRNDKGWVLSQSGSDIQTPNENSAGAGPQAPITTAKKPPSPVPGNQPFSAKVNRLLPEMMETYCTPSTI